MQLPEFLTEQPSGSVRLTGHRIALEHFVYFYNQGYAPEMILGQFPSLPLAVIHKVIAYYLEHQPEVDSYVAGRESEISKQRTVAGASPDLAELRRRVSQLSVPALP
jgi:uncharacterized protein (DUF433 family)